MSDLPITIDLEAECLAITAGLLTAEAFAILTARLKPEDFAHPPARQVLELAVRMRDKGQEVGLDTVTAALTLDTGGDRMKVAEMMAVIAKPLQPENLDHYIARVEESAAKRQVIARCQDVMRKAGNPRCDDWREAAEAVGRNLNGNPSALREKLAVRRFDFARRPEKPIPVISLGGHPISTAGNITNVQAKAKAGKTAGFSGIIGAACCQDGQGLDCLGFESENPDGKAVIHFDTEQSRFDADALIRRSLFRGGMDSVPPWLSSFSLADMDKRDRRKALPLVMEDAAQECGGIHFVLVDGVADLCPALNDDVGAFELVEEIHGLAIRFKCPIITTLHENPGSENGKTRGHLGSELERKAETNLRFVKGADGITTIYTELSRSCHIPKDEGFCFRWSEEAQMHVSCGGAAEVNERATKAKAMREAEKSFGGAEALGYSELVGKIKKALGLQDRAAKGRIGAFRELGVLHQNEAGLLEIMKP